MGTKHVAIQVHKERGGKGGKCRGFLCAVSSSFLLLVCTTFVITGVEEERE